MKNSCIIIPILLLVIMSCSKDSETDDEKSYPFVLDNPEVNLNIISSGELPYKIHSITSDNYLNNPPDTYTLEYYGLTNKIKKVFYQSNNLCENETNAFFYRSDNLISRVENLKIRHCEPEFQSVTTYNYNYEGDVLKSVIGRNESFIYEAFFSYNPNGTIKEIYTNSRPINETHYGYTKTKLAYDENYNVVEITGEDYYSPTYDSRTTIEYDNKINPLKGLFVMNIFNNPIKFFGYLNTNNSIYIKSEYLNIEAQPTENFYQTTFEDQKLRSYGDIDGYPFWRQYFINYE